MATDIINGVLSVPEFTPTGNPGEYTFANATYNNQADLGGLGTDAIQIGFILFIPAVDINSYTLIPGVFHRYRLTDLTRVDTYHLNGTILWDEGGDEIDVPAIEVACIISQPSAHHQFGFPVSNEIYSSLLPGFVSAAFNIDTNTITDNFDGSALTLGALPGPYTQGAVALTEGQKISDALDKINAFMASLVVPTFSSTFSAANWTVKPSETYPSIILNHGLGTSSLKVDIFEENAGFFSPAYVEWAANDTYIKMTISNTAYTAFSGKIEVRPI